MIITSDKRQRQEIVLQFDLPGTSQHFTIEVTLWGKSEDAAIKELLEELNHAGEAWVERQKR